MLEFLRTAGQSIKKHHFAAYIVGYIVFIATVTMAIVLSVLKFWADFI